MLLSSIRLDGFLSFAPGSPAIPLQRLNVLIGPSGSGKANLIEAIELLQAMPTGRSGLDVTLGTDATDSSSTTTPLGAIIRDRTANERGRSMARAVSRGLQRSGWPTILLPHRPEANAPPRASRRSA